MGYAQPEKGKCLRCGAYSMLYATEEDTEPEWCDACIAHYDALYEAYSEEVTNARLD